MSEPVLVICPRCGARAVAWQDKATAEKTHCLGCGLPFTASEDDVLALPQRRPARGDGGSWN